MDVSSISAALGMQQDLASKNAASANSTEFKETFEKALSGKDDDKLKEACDEIETYMLSMLFKQVKDSMLSKDEDGLLPKGDYIKMFEGNMINTVAEEATKAGGIGLSKMLYEQMKSTYDAQMQVSNGNTEKATQNIEEEL